MRLSVDAPKDRQSVTSDWHATFTKTIEGVVAREVKNVLVDNGAVVELLRAEWLGPSHEVDQVFLRTLDAGTVSAWHVHHSTTDRLFCVGGRALIALYDARKSSPTHEVVAEYRVSLRRPTLLIVPPGVFHGVKALGGEPTILINMVNVAYSYSDPDHARLPPDTAEIPYRFP